MSIRTNNQPAPTRRGSLRSGPVNCPGSGAETTLVTFDTPAGLHSYLVSRAYFVAGAPTDVKFRLYCGGAPVGDDVEFDRNTQLGAIGNPQPENPPHYSGAGGKRYKITVINNDAGAYSCECDGVVESYREKLFP